MGDHNIGDRMKRYENVWRFHLVRRTPVIVRVDGRAFHSFTRGAEKPWDNAIETGMNKVAIALMHDIQGARLAYIQSDEVSVLLIDYNTLHSEPWFSGNLQKIASCAASTATVAFGNGAMFDARAFNMPREEVVNYFLWRQQDAERNSIQSLSHVHFSEKELYGKSGGMMQEMLFTEKGINWNNVPTHRKRGWCLTENGPDYDIPRFGKDREYIQSLVNRIEEE